MSGRIVEYTVVFDITPIGIEQKVNEYLGEGWKLYGTPFADGDYFCQAMVREVYPTGKKGMAP